MNELQTALEALRIFLCRALCSGSSLGKTKIGIEAGFANETGRRHVGQLFEHR